MPPRIGQTLRVEGVDERSYLVQLEQTRARRNQQAQRELDRRHMLDKFEPFQGIEKLGVTFEGRPGREGNERGVENHVQAPEQLHQPEKVLPRMALVQPGQNGVIERFHRRGDKQAARIAEHRQQGGVLEQMFDLRCDVIGQRREFSMQALHQFQRMPGSVEKIRVTEGDVLGTGGYLAANIFYNNIVGHHAEAPVVDRHNGTMAATMLAAPTGFGVPHQPLLTARQNQPRIALERRQRASVRNAKRQSFYGYLNLWPYRLLAAGQSVHQIRQCTFELSTQDPIHTEVLEVAGVQGCVESVAAQNGARVDPDRKSVV